MFNRHKPKLEPALPLELRLRYSTIDRIPKINWLRYYWQKTTNKSSKFVKYVLLASIPVCFLILLILLKPDHVEPPGEIAAKLAQLHNINVMLIMLNIFILIVKIFRIPIPRNQYM
jgi:undecaprenyl pyrophosphate phosphatase UppP